MVFFKAPKSQKENVYNCSKCYIILNIHCFSHLPYLYMILIVKVTLDNIFHILVIVPIKESKFAPHQLRLVYTSVGKLPVHDEILKQKCL